MMHSDDEYFEVDAVEYGWGSMLGDQLAHTPWWASSLALHLALILVVLPMIECQVPSKSLPIRLKASIEPMAEEELEEEKEQLDESEVKNPDQPQIEDPVETETPPDTENETAVDMDFQESKGEDSHSDSNLAYKFNNEAIGSGGGAGGPYGRGRGGRRKRVRGGGGTSKTERAVLAGLIWLRNHQSPSGRWDGDGFQAQCKENTCSGVAKMTWVDPGLTSLALLAFLADGNTHRFGRFKLTVRKGLRYLIKIQSADGMVGRKTGEYLYNHAIAACVLAEGYGMSKGSPMLRLPARKAIGFLLKARIPGQGWRYIETDKKGDISVTGWAVMALKAAKRAEMKIPGLDAAFTEVGKWIDDSLTDTSYHVTGYQEKPMLENEKPMLENRSGTSSRFWSEVEAVDTRNTHAVNHTPTALATMCRVFLGRSKRDPLLRGGARVVSSQLPVWDVGGGGKLSQIDFYYWYYGTLAMFQMGGDYWRAWNKKLKSALVDHQRGDGHEHGSWDPRGAWGFAGGRVYATAINVLSLQIYYRYPRVLR